MEIRQKNIQEGQCRDNDVVLNLASAAPTTVAGLVDQITGALSAVRARS